jgi:DNA polymerase III alpha subunit
MSKAYGFFMETTSQKVGKEAAQQIWDGLVQFSAYSFGLNHSTAYCVISYACAFLKHHYPLEWWTSVMGNATKEEINDKFWQHCGHLVLLPDIVKSQSTWEIEGDKIRAPVSMLFGMGEGAQSQLSKGLPYTDLRSFCSAIVKHQKDNMETKDKLVKGEPKKVTVWGRNALNVSMVSNMIITGCMDSFFEPDTSEAAKLDAYHAMMKELYAAEGKKYAQSKKKMPQLDALGRYQSKKTILPPYGEDLGPLLIALGKIPEYLQVDGSYIRMKGDTTDRYGKVEDRWDPVVAGERLTSWECDVGSKWLRCGILAYIENKEVISGKNKQRLQFNFDVGGKKIQSVVWPDDNNKFPEFSEKPAKGSIVAAIVLKGPKGYSVKDIKVLREPLGVDNKVEEE